MKDMFLIKLRRHIYWSPFFLKSILYKKTELKKAYSDRYVICECVSESENVYKIFNTKLLIGLSWTDFIVNLSNYYKIKFKKHNLEIRGFFDFESDHAVKNFLSDKSYDCVDAHTYLLETYGEIPSALSNGTIERLLDSKEIIINDRYIGLNKVGDLNKCEYCGNYHLGAHMYNDKSICTICKKKINVCTSCGKEKFIAVERDEEHFCEECVDPNKLSTCIKCKNTFLTSDNILNKQGYCNICAHTIKTNWTVERWSYEPNIIFHNEKNDDKLYFGFEIEVQNPKTNKLKASNYIQSIINKNNFYIYCMEDSSIDGLGTNRYGPGFEIATQPMTFNFIKNNQHIFNHISSLKLYGFRAWNAPTCGIHIHMSRDCFTPTHLYKFLHFYYENPTFIYIISDRNDATWFDRQCSLDKRRIDYKLASIGSYMTDDKHMAVNINKSNTIEIRIFRSTLNLKRIMKNVEFCKATFDFTKAKNIKNVSFENFIHYLNNKKTIYPNLHDFYYKYYINDSNMKEVLKCV